MAGLTKAQRAEKAARLTVVETEAGKLPEVVEKVPKKYRYDFNSWDEYNKYGGEKG